MAVHILGIRHHGVGSARHVREQLQMLKPDYVLVEGPPEISDVLKTIGHLNLIPPVAIMVYNPDSPKESVFYPFAEYSPEWVAVNYANANKVPVRALDLPASISFSRAKRTIESEKEPEASSEEVDSPQEEMAEKILKKHRREPLSYLAEAAGYASGEEWWDQFFENRSVVDEGHFDGVMHAMEALRTEGLTSFLDEENVYREAFMRSIIRQVQNEMYERIVVVCGAWHAPALVDLDGSAKQDAKILKSLPKSKIKATATWIPWTNSRLSMFSGYGAGIVSPGWYEHQWKTSHEVEISWLAKVAETFRKRGIDISTSHVIEAYHLSRALAVLRDRPSISLEELNEATLAVMCMGDGILLELIRNNLIVGNKLGKVPDDIPKVPLQEDFEQEIRSLRLKLTAAPKQYDLDLRKDNDLARSILFHRLEILEVPWAARTDSRSKGTFKESWTTEWQPEMMIALIEKAFYGNTIAAAAQAVILKEASHSQEVSEVAGLIQKSIPAELYDELAILLDKINELSAISADVVDLMRAIPPLVEVSRYGNVRKSDLSVLNAFVRQLFDKIFISLPNACYGLDEENSVNMFNLIVQVNNAIRLYENNEVQSQWYDTLHSLIDKTGIHAVILGCVCRLLLDAQHLSDAEIDQRLSFALSINNDPHHVAAWLEGFLSGSGSILIYDSRLWSLLYAWVATLPQEMFMELLPLLRRAFSKFEYGERRQIGEKAKRGISSQTAVLKEREENFNEELAVGVLPTIRLLLGQ